MHLSMFSPRVGVVGIPLALDQQKITSPGNLTEQFDRGMDTLFAIPFALDALDRNSRINYV